MNTRKMMALLTLVLALGLTNVAGAEVLWDQTEGYESWQMGFFNCIAGGPPMGITQYTASDVVVPEGGWTIDEVKIYFDGFDPSWAGAVTSAILYVEPKTGAMPTGDASTGTAVAVTAEVLSNNFLTVTASGLDLALDAGEYWIGLTPTTPNANNIHVSVALVGAETASYDPFGFPVPGWANWAPGVDAAILISGMGPVATENINLGSVKALYR